MFKKTFPLAQRRLVRVLWKSAVAADVSFATHSPPSSVALSARHASGKQACGCWPAGAYFCFGRGMRRLRASAAVSTRVHHPLRLAACVPAHCLARLGARRPVCECSLPRGCAWLPKRRAYSSSSKFKEGCSKRTIISEGCM